MTHQDGRLRAFTRGLQAIFCEGPTLTYDGDPESPRSVAFDQGMNVGERLRTTFDLRRNLRRPLPKWLHPNEPARQFYIIMVEYDPRNTPRSKDVVTAIRQQIINGMMTPNNEQLEDFSVDVRN